MVLGRNDSLGRPRVPARDLLPALVLALFAAASPATAHAPTPRQVVTTADAAGIVVDLPGFGLLLRTSPDQPFSYACSSLFELVPDGEPPGLAFRTDGSLLVASRDGLKTFTAGGCPLASDMNTLAHAEIIRLALQSGLSREDGESQTGYAVVGGESSGLWRTTDGGRGWALQSALDDAQLATALVMRADRPEQVYLSVEGLMGSTVYASSNGGAALEAFVQDTSLKLLHAEGKASGRLWALARDEQSVGNRGFAILRAEGPAGPWLTVLRVNYFGGFVVDPDGVIWVGDEIGGVYRSGDGGETFANMEAEADVACVAYGGSSLWACNPAAPQDPLLQVLAGGQAPFTGVVALADVGRLVECPGLDVAHTCARAWVEWERDVLMRPVESTPLPLADAGASPSEPGPTAAESSGCALYVQDARSPNTSGGLGLLLLAVCLRRRTIFPV